MNFDLFKEGVGYAASLIILVSLLMTNVFRLRVINGLGSVLFAVYGWLIGSWPVCAINAVIAGIDGWYLLRSLRVSAIYELSHLLGLPRIHVASEETQVPLLMTRTGDQRAAIRIDGVVYRTLLDPQAVTAVWLVQRKGAQTPMAKGFVELLTRKAAQ